MAATPAAFEDTLPFETVSERVAALGRYHRAIVLAFMFALASPLRIAEAAVRSNDQIGALETAETFAYAWASRDAKMGAATLDFGRSEGSPAPSAIRAYFVGLSSPHHAAFAIERMKRIGVGGYACTLTLYEYLYAGHGHGDYSAVTVTIDLYRKHDAWKVVAVAGLYGS